MAKWFPFHKQGSIVLLTKSSLLEAHRQNMDSSRGWNIYKLFENILRLLNAPSLLQTVARKFGFAFKFFIPTPLGNQRDFKGIYDAYRKVVVSLED